jgi:hypothetical protein
VLHEAAQLGKLEVFQGIFSLAKENLTTEEVNKFLLAVDNEGRPVFKVAANFSTQEVLQEIFNYAKDNLNLEEVN